MAALTMLGIATIQDMSKREASDRLWVCFGIIGIVLVLFAPDIFSRLVAIGISLIVLPLALIAYKIGLFGGADVFAITVLAILSPQSTMEGNYVTPFTILSNAAVLGLLPFFANAAQNCIAMLKKEPIFDGYEESSIKKLIAVFVGYRAKNPKHSFSIEKIENNSKKFNFVLHHAEKSDYCQISDCWVTPGLPFLVFITFGFLIQIVYGDILFNILRLLF